MDEDSTQPSTYPVEQGDRGRSSDNLSLEDELDIICLLRPCSPAAFEIAEKVAKITPQHVLQSGEIPQRYLRVIEMADQVESRNRLSPADVGPEVTPDLAEIDMPDYASNGVADIALRLSSRVTDMDMGFVFGRDQRKCDIVLPVEDRTAARISGMHFRIFLNDNGMIMLEDTSTNGTLVDNFLLKHKHPTPGNSVRRIIQKGSVVAVFVKADRTTARFIVDIPQRRDEAAWRKRLEDYVAAVKRSRSQKMILLKTLGTDKSTARKTDRHAHNIGAPKTEVHPSGNLFLTAGTTPWNHGMRWNGGGRFNVIARLGSGAFATVYKLVDASTGDELAAKEIEKRRFMKNGVLDMKITSELNILKRLKHPHVIESFDHVDTSRDLYILMELVPYGDLSMHVGTPDKLNDQDMRLIAKQMCQALAYLHDNGIAHRDIKPENIIKKAVEPLWIKLADFGLSKIITQDDHHTAYQTFCGTLLYCAPEVYPGFAFKRAGLPPDPRTTKPSPYSTAVDIWSLSAVLFHLLCGKPPYEASAANHGIHMLDRIFEERFPRQKFDEAEVHRDWDLFFENTLQLTAQQRWSARRLLKMPWMRQIPEVVPVSYVYLNPDQDFAVEDESSDDDMEDFDDLDDGLATGMPDASQLSLNNDPFSDDEDTSASDTNEPQISGFQGMPGEGLGIDVGSGRPASSINYPELGNQASSRQRAHEPGIPRAPFRRGSGQPFNVTPRQASSGALVSLPPHGGRLFGEITDSGVFGAATPKPRIVDPLAWRSSDFASAGQTSKQVSNLNAGSDAFRSKHELSDFESEVNTLKSPKRSRVFSQHQYSTHMQGDPSTYTKKPNAVHHNAKAEVAINAVARLPDLNLNSNTAVAPDSNTSALPNTAITGTFPPGITSPSWPHGGNISSASTNRPQPISSDPHSVSMANSSRPATPQVNERSGVVALGVLTPGRKSVAVDPVYVTLQQTQYGRAPECTHRYPDPMDTRVPKSAFTIFLHDPAGNDNDIQKDWTTTRFYAVIGTRCSGHILINNIPMTRNKSEDKRNEQLGFLQTGDIIEVFDRSDNHLRFHVQFWFGAAKEKRNKREPFKVVLGNEEVQRIIMDKERQRAV